MSNTYNNVIPTKVGIHKFVLLFFLSLSPLVYGQNADLDMKAREIADQLRCPVCRGVPIAESPSELAQSMMQVIREKLAAGESREQILDYFVDRYGDWILLKPKAEGFNLTIWIMPFVVFLGGAGVLTYAVIKWSRHKA